MTLLRVSCKFSRVLSRGYSYLMEWSVFLFSSSPRLYTQCELFCFESPGSDPAVFLTASDLHHIPVINVPWAFFPLCLTTSASLHTLLQCQTDGDFHFLTSRSFWQVFCVKSQEATSQTLHLPWPELHKFHDCLYCHQTHYTSHYSAGQPCHRQH